MNILVLNCGSSSLKYQLINMDDESVIAKGLVERIGIDGSILTHKPAGKDKYVVETPMKDHNIAVKLVLDALIDAEHGVIKSTDEIAAVGHRVLHAGEKYKESVIVTEDVKNVVRECFDLGPLHNPANLIGIEAVEAAMPGKPNVAVWDTAFGGTMEPKAYLYAIPREYYEKYHVRRYGFHGTSHSFVSKETIKYLNLDKDNAKVIVCHLGNGASISASIGGKCVDTSMGLTPLEGLIMGTRSGDLDPAILEYLCNHENLTISEMLNILNKKSGVLGMSGGISSDFRDLNAAMNEGNEVAKQTLEAYAYRVAKYIGSYVAAMNGVDAITFTAGVGENATWLRPMVAQYLGYLGIKLDEAKSNAAVGEYGVISTDDSKVKVCVIPTNEELAIARETLALVK
ncbi:MAG: acetate kinase [Thermoflexaceae bacterium]|nr:acetate kinase [Thermoflexaceae bacterium]